MLKNHFLTERQTIMKAWELVAETWENTIEKVIGYTFKNKALLRQAFTRRSFTQENGGQNNEILEFIGDKVLDVTVVKILIDHLIACIRKHLFCFVRGACLCHLQFAEKFSSGSCRAYGQDNCAYHCKHKE
jgi:hypothetical protein